MTAPEAARFWLARGEPRLAPGLPLRVVVVYEFRVLFGLESVEIEARPYGAGKVPRVAMSYAEGNSTCMLVLSFRDGLCSLFWRANHSATSALDYTVKHPTEAERNHSSVLFALHTRTHNVLFMCQLFTSGLMTCVS